MEPSAPHPIRWGRQGPTVSLNPGSSTAGGRATPREMAMGRHPSESRFKQTLREDDPVRLRRAEVRRQRAASAGPKYRPPPPSAATVKRAGQAEQERREQMQRGEEDSDWRAGSHRFANAHFHDTLRSWPRCRDVCETTRSDWRVSAEDTLGLGGTAFGHDMSNNDADGWKRSSSVWTEKSYRAGLRDYKGVDVGYDEQGGNKSAGTKDRKQAAGTNLGSIYRDHKQSERLSTARADEHFLGSLRCEQRKPIEDYQRTRRAHLNLPQYKELTKEQVTQAKRIFASIDLDGSGTLDAEEIRKFLVAMGHKGTDKAVRKLLDAGDTEGTKDSKFAIREFARVFHGIKL